MEIPNGFAHCALVFDLSNDSGELITTLAVEHQASSPAGANDVAEDVRASWAADILPAQSSDLSLIRVDAQVRDVTSGALYSATTGAAAAVGGAAFAQLPGFVSAVVKKITGQAGRKYRGRMFVPGLLGDNDVGNDSRITNGRQTEINDAFADLLSTLNGLNHSPYLLHTDPLIPPTAITTFQASATIGGIRSRRD